MTTKKGEKSLKEVSNVTKTEETQPSTTFKTKIDFYHSDSDNEEKKAENDFIVFKEKSSKRSSAKSSSTNSKEDTSKDKAGNQKGNVNNNNNDTENSTNSKKGKKNNKTNNKKNKNGKNSKTKSKNADNTRGDQSNDNGNGSNDEKNKNSINENRDIVDENKKLSPDEKTEENKNGEVPQNIDFTLHRKWQIWFDNPKMAKPGESWKDNLKKCSKPFQDVPSFWCIYNHIKPPTELSVSSNYHIFVDGVEPMWEDPSNKRGGKFVLTIPKPKKLPMGEEDRLDQWWLSTTLAVIGETMDKNGNEIMGAVVSVRKNEDRIALWLRSGRKEVCVAIGKEWKSILDIKKTTLKYQFHKDAAASGSSFKNRVVFTA